KVDIANLEVEDEFSAADIDSLDQMNLLLALEEHYNIKIPDEDLPKLTSLKNILAYLSTKAGQEKQ
ncbi:MAG: acyl carrier protein, partial [Thermotogae bacterium]|nr:acyl carrier protein [Thermotogota bacterium]